MRCLTINREPKAFALTKDRLLAEEGPIVFLRFYGTRGLLNPLFKHIQSMKSRGWLNLIPRVRKLIEGDFEVIRRMHDLLDFFQLVDPPSRFWNSPVDFFLQKLDQLMKLTKRRIQEKLEAHDDPQQLANLYIYMAEICREDEKEYEEVSEWDLILEKVLVEGCHNQPLDAGEMDLFDGLPDSDEEDKLADYKPFHFRPRDAKEEEEGSFEEFSFLKKRKLEK